MRVLASFVKSQYNAPAKKQGKQVLGAGGTQTLAFKALVRGVAVITIVYKRAPGKTATKNIQPITKQVFDVTIQ
jgi:predicted secreted protein